MNHLQSLLNDLLLTGLFREAVSEALAGEQDHLSKALRSAARNGETIKAAHVEGQLHSVESFLQILDRYVKKSKTQ